MRAHARWSKVCYSLGGVLGFLFLTATSARADGIAFQLVASTLTAASGGTVTFDGTVTNNTGGDLNATDFFFNFLAFDPTSLNPIQDLGVVTDFLIPNGSTTVDVSLFDVVVGSVSPGSTFTLEVQLEDVNLDASATQTVAITVPGTQSVPEPPTELFLLTGFLPLALWKLRRA
jgi:hypothetical protein